MAVHHKFSKRSETELAGMEPDLVRVFRRALILSKYDFGVTEGLRTLAEQEKHVASGASQTMNSRHLPNKNGLSEAGDILIYINGKHTYDPKRYRKVAAAFFKAAFEEQVEIEWGGHYETLFDGPHFNLASRK